jgi:long-chain acyl-CoA synthetase
MHAWEATYPPTCRWDTPIAQGTVPAFLDGLAASWGEKPALEYRGRVLSFNELRRRADRVAAGLMARGLRPGEAVALYLPNTPWHPVFFFGVLRAGGRVVHLSALDARRELAHKLQDSGARLIVTTGLPTLLANTAWLLEEGAAEGAILAPDAEWGGEDAATEARLDPAPEAEPPTAWPVLAPEDVALLQYTGGTTGTPKGAVLTHGNITAAVNIYLAWRDAASLPQGEQRVLLALPLFHIFALTAVLMRQLAEGNLVMLRPRFDAAQWADDVERHRVSAFSGVPTMWIAIGNLPGIERRDLSSLRLCSSGGAPMPFEVQTRLEALLGTRIGGGWGMTETCPAGTRITLDAPRRPGMIGVPLPGVELRIVSLDDPSRVLPPGEMGQMAVRGPNVFGGYWNRPEESAACFHEGFFLTGDIGWMDERGFFTLVDRAKNMIISSGFNVYPAAIEQAVYEHPDVAECIVIGIPDEYRGQAAKAFVALKPGARPFTLDELRAFLADRIGRHEMPAALEIRDSLPKTPAGKLLAAALRAEDAAARA